MKKKKIIGIIIIFILLFVGLVTYFIISFNNDKKETINKMNRISTSYDNFKTDALKFNEVRQDLYTNIFNGIYYDTLKVNYDIWISKLSNYEDVIDDIDNNNEFLRKSCKDIYYPEQEINNKCNAFSIAYEEINNSFVYDIKLFNDNINNYNEYMDSISGDKLQLYKTDREYIDYNNDKIYLGKEGESSNE